jgi:hypothetical protein
MALFIDGTPSSIEDLTNQDSGLLEVCRTEQINTTIKLRLAHDEIAVELAALFERQRSLYTPYYGQPKLSLSHLAVTPALKMWHTWQTLALVYRDAYFNQLNDRFQAKWDQFQKLAGSARTRLQEVGIGLVLDPLSRPNSPILTPTPATETGGTFYFAISLLNASGEESASSVAESIQVADGNAVDVQLVSPPANALGWNVYVGVNPESMYLQNESSISTDEDWIFYPSTAVSSGETPGDGQKPNLIRALPRLIQRG